MTEEAGDAYVEFLASKDPNFYPRPHDPVHRAEDGLWYFWDETWANRDGPFSDEAAAREALAKYVEWLG